MEGGETSRLLWQCVTRGELDTEIEVGELFDTVEDMIIRAFTCRWTVISAKVISGKRC